MRGWFKDIAMIFLLCSGFLCNFIQNINELVLSCCLEPRFFGFCALMKAFLSSIAVATVGEKDKIRGQNAKIAGKRTTQDEFNNNIPFSVYL